MLSRKIFKDTISFIQERQRAEFEMSEIFSKEFSDCDFFPYSQYEAKMIELLSALMEDESGWISYFIYELEFGDKYEDGDVTATDKDGKEVNIPMKTTDDLYDVLANNIAAKNVNELTKEVSEIIQEEIPNFIIPRKKYYQGREGVIEEALDICSLRVVKKIKGEI